MNTTEHLARRVLGPADPLPADQPLEAGELRRAALLADRITAAPPASPVAVRVERRALRPVLARLTEAPLASPVAVRAERHTLRPVLASASALVVVVLVAAASLTVPGSPFQAAPAFAATPPLLLPLEPPTGPAAQVLATAADAAAALPPLGPGSHDHVSTASWYLDTAVAGGSSRSEVVARLTDVWAAPDGTVTVAEAAGDPRESSAPGPDADADAIGALPRDGEAEVMQYAPGEHALDAPDLATDPATLRAALLSEQQVPDAAELLVAVGAILRTSPVEPTQLAALWRALALQPDLVSYGEVTDRAVAGAWL